MLVTSCVKSSFSLEFATRCAEPSSATRRRLSLTVSFSMARYFRRSASGFVKKFTRLSCIDVV
jgi:hypothetical protein